MNEKDHRLDDYFEQYSDAILLRIYRIVKDYYMAEDLCQETFIRLGENLDKVPPDKVPGWLLRVSGRVALDHLKKGGQYKMELGLDMREEIAYEIYPDVSSILEKKEELHEKYEVYLQLREEKPDLYEALHMSCVEEMDNRAIGEELHIKSSLVSKRKERGRSWLRERYEAYRKKGS